LTCLRAGITLKAMQFETHSSVPAKTFSDEKNYQQKRAICQELSALYLASQSEFYQSFSRSFKLNYHGLAIELHSRNLDLSDWQAMLHGQLQSDNANLAEQLPIKFFWIHPQDFAFKSNDFEEMTSPECHIQVQNNCEWAIQRDFCAINFNHGDIVLVTDPENPDGIYNVLRWVLPRLLIKHKMAVLHSSCVIGKSGRAHFFLGPSGAGKTTSAKLAGSRLVLGDDMNLFLQQDQTYWAASALLGGIIQNKREERFPVAGFFWLKQASENSIKKLPAASALKYFCASCANLFWGYGGQDMASSLLTWGMPIVEQVPFYEMKFTKDGGFWDVLAKHAMD